MDLFKNKKVSTAAVHEIYDFGFEQMIWDMVQEFATDYFIKIEVGNSEIKLSQEEPRKEQVYQIPKVDIDKLPSIKDKYRILWAIDDEYEVCTLLFPWEY